MRGAQCWKKSLARRRRFAGASQRIGTRRREKFLSARDWRDLQYAQRRMKGKLPGTSFWNIAWKLPATRRCIFEQSTVEAKQRAWIGDINPRNTKAFSPLSNALCTSSRDYCEVLASSARSFSACRRIFLRCAAARINIKVYRAISRSLKYVEYKETQTFFFPLLIRASELGISRIGKSDRDLQVTVQEK